MVLMPFLKEISKKSRSRWEVRNGKLDIEVGSENKPTSHFNNPASHFQLLTSWLYGFSLIEFLVVVSIFGIAASLITASYLNFERNQKVRGVASQLKSDLRLTQNRALSGDKGPGGKCAANSNLGGWYLAIEEGKQVYKIGGDCLGSGFEETAFEKRTVNLPGDIKVKRIFYGVSDTTHLVIFFRPLAGGVTFHNASALANEDTPDFFEPSGTLKNYLTAPPQSVLTIEFSNLDGTRKYQVKIEVTGEVSDVKPQ